MQYCIKIFEIYKIEKSFNISKFPYFNIENASSKSNFNNIRHIWQIMYFYIPILFHLCHNCPILRKCIEFHRFRNPNKKRQRHLYKTDIVQSNCNYILYKYLSAALQIHRALIKFQVMNYRNRISFVHLHIGSRMHNFDQYRMK